MILVETHIFKQNHKFYKELDNLCFLSKNLYNATLYDIRQYFFNTQKYKNYCTINKEFSQNNQQDYRALPSKVSQQIQKIVDKNFKSFFELLKLKKQNKYNKKVSIPKYLDSIKGRQIVPYTKQALSLKEQNYIKLSGTDIKIKTKIDKNKIQALRIVPCNGYVKIEVLYNETEKKVKTNQNYASIDLGLNNLMTLVFTNHKPLIINGKPLKSINQYYNKKKAKIVSKLIKVNNKYTSKRLQKLSLKRNNKINDYLYKSVSYLMNQLVSNDISTLVVGYNKSWKQDINMGKVNNQNFTQIPFYKLLTMISYKCKLLGINLITHEESYTSKCSFLDKEDICKHDVYKGKRVKRGLFRSENGITINADVNGSYNILKKVVGNMTYDVIDPIEACNRPYKYSVQY